MCFVLLSFCANAKNKKENKMKTTYKLIFATPLLAVTMGACRTVYYPNTVSAVYDNKKIIVKNDANEERMIDCSKKTKENAQLSQDLPYFKEGDQVQLKPIRASQDNYVGHRVFSIADYELVYPLDTIQIRKDMEIIAKQKAEHIRIDTVSQR